MAPKDSSSSSLVSLSQALPLVPSCVCPSAPCGQTPPLAPSSSFLSMPTMPSLYPQFPCTNSLAKLPFSSETLPTPFSSVPIRTCPSKIKSSEYPEAIPLISYILWTKPELQAVVKNFPKVS